MAQLTLRCGCTLWNDGQHLGIHWCQTHEAAEFLLESLRAVLPLAERYLAKAPSAPENGYLEDARAALAKAGVTAEERRSLGLKG